MINADELQKIAQLFERHTFEQSRGNPRFIVRSNGVIEAFTYADADTLQKALELFPAIFARITELELQLAHLNRFAGNIIGYDDGGILDVDGGEIQDLAVECGLLKAVNVTESCATGAGRCACAEEADFPCTCYRPTDLGKAALAAGG